MTKLALAAGVMTLALTAAGCAQLSAARDFINQPATQEAFATIGRVSTAIVCDIRAGSELAKSVEGQVGAHQGITGQVDVVSSAVCKALQGRVVTGATDQNAAAVVAVTP